MIEVIRSEENKSLPRGGKGWCSCRVLSLYNPHKTVVFMNCCWPEVKVFFCSTALLTASQRAHTGRRLNGNCNALVSGELRLNAEFA